MDKQEVLKKYFGHDSFRSGQEDIIDNIMSRRDCLGVMPTGAGKSMCYQIPALLLEGTSIVISPLISLMKDQVEALRQSGVPAMYINSSLTAHEFYQTLDCVAAGKCRLLYVAPERLPVGAFVELCRSIKIPLVAVDESHCVSQWGQDFRPSYLEIAKFVASLPERPVVAAFTATATAAVKKDIEEILQLRDPFRITTGFDRENLYFEVRKRNPSEKDGELIRILRESGKRSTIVYCSTRKTVDSVCATLKLNGFSAAKYHAGLEAEERATAQEDFIYDRVNVIVATNAFGMGIDKSDVSLVVHYNMPKDIESYYQEAGRAGRDGSPARCILLYSGVDVRTNTFLIEHGKEDSAISPELAELLMERDKERLKQMTFYSTTNRCLRAFMLRYFGEKAGSFCGNCGSCNSDYDTVDVTISAQKIISCIFRMKQRGIAAEKQSVVSVLRGEEASEELQALSTFGIMREVKGSEIEAVMAYLTELGYIEGEPMSLTDSADEFIKSRRTLLMKRPRSSAGTAEAAPVRQYTMGEENPILMERLRELRQRTATTLGVPAYAIFTDVSLRDMSIKMPLTTAEFLRVNGVGSLKAERFGNQFTEVIRSYVEEHEPQRLAHGRKSEKTTKAEQNAQAANPELMEQLKQLRRTLAAEQKVPPFIIFYDTALRGMCDTLPVTEEEFLRINGVGAAKLERYGEQFMEVIRRYKTCK